MPLTLDQYAAHLDTRGDLTWPAPPVPDPVKAKPSLGRIPGLKAIAWNVYGTLIAIPYGELLFEHPTALIMDVALDKTITEFKFWPAMSRKPGKPSDYMKAIYSQVLLELRSLAAQDRYPEIVAEKIWETIVKNKLRDYTFNVGFYGSLNEFARKVAYYFHASLQGTAAQPEAATALRIGAAAHLEQALLGDGQVFTAVQLARGLKAQDATLNLDETVPGPLRILSCDVKARKPSEALFRAGLAALAAKGIKPAEVLHVGSKLARDIAPAKRFGLKTALYAGDRASLEATPEQLKDPAHRPDVLLTRLDQIADVVR